MHEAQKQAAADADASQVCSAAAGPVSGRDPFARRRLSEILDRLSCTIVVDGCPIVGEDRKAKLIGAILKFAAKHGVQLSEDMLEMPAGEDGQSKG